MSGKLIPGEALPGSLRREKGRAAGVPLIPGYQYFRRPDGSIYGMSPGQVTQQVIEHRIHRGHMPLDDKLRPITQRGKNG